MTEFNRDIWEIISSVLNGNPTAEELSIFNSWLNENEGNKKLYESILNSPQQNESFSRQAKERVFAKIENQINASKPVPRINLWAYSAVASIAILITFTLTYILFRNSSSSVQESYIEAKTPYGVKSKIVLPDNSVVYLNAGSVLKYPATFNKKQRKVKLNGEAYFEIEKDTECPFIVETGEVNIKVLGTHFNVKNYDVDNIIETSLLEGAVEVSEVNRESTNKIILAHNQQALYNKDSHKITKNSVDAELTAIWKDGKYYFDHEKFSTITTKLERYFNYEIQIKSEKLNETIFSGLFDKNKTIFQILDIMKSYSNFRYTVKKDTITIEDIK